MQYIPLPETEMMAEGWGYGFEESGGLVHDRLDLERAGLFVSLGEW